MPTGYLITTQGDTLRGQLAAPRLATYRGITLHLPAQASRHFEARELRAVSLPNGRYLVRRALAAGRNPTTGAIDSVAVLLQPLVTGAATLYRYDATPDIQSREEGRTEAVQYFVALSRSNLVRLRPQAYQATLTALFKDCPTAVEAIPRTTFTQDRLADLVLRYSTQCRPDIPSLDYRPRPVPSSLRLLVSLRAGAQRGKLFYKQSGPLGEATAQPTTTGVLGLELRLANAGPFSLSSGLHYLWLRNEPTLIQSAQLGTTNAGQSLALPSSVMVQQLQVPVLLRYTLGKHLWRPYVAAGPTFGFYRNNRTSLAYTTLTYVGGTSTYYREDVVQEAVRADEGSAHLVVGGTLRAGLQLQAGARFAPLLEAYYSIGRDSSYNPGLPNNQNVAPDIGDLQYQTLGLLLGLEF